jgi:hypothetical protein
VLYNAAYEPSHVKAKTPMKLYKGYCRIRRSLRIIEEKTGFHLRANSHTSKNTKSAYSRIFQSLEETL